MEKLKNKIELDGYIYGEPKIYDNFINFTLTSIATSKYNEETKKWKNTYNINQVNIPCINDEDKKMFKKGAWVEIEAKLATNKYEKDGKKIYTPLFLASTVKFKEGTADNIITTVEKSYKNEGE